MSVTIEYAVTQEPNYSGFVVFGAGLPRTGTMSLRAALGQLLQGKTVQNSSNISKVSSCTNRGICCLLVWSCSVPLHYNLLLL